MKKTLVFVILLIWVSDAMAQMSRVDSIKQQMH